MCSSGYHEKMIGRPYFGGDQVTQLNLVLYNTIKRPYQPKASIFIFLGLRISWPEKRDGRSEKKNLKNNYIGPIMSSCRNKVTRE